jgi:hypothetical protein
VKSSERGEYTAYPYYPTRELARRELGAEMMHRVSVVASEIDVYSSLPPRVWKKYRALGHKTDKKEGFGNRTSFPRKRESIFYCIYGYYLLYYVKMQ